MGSDIPGKVAVDLLSIPPLVFRIIRSKLINITLADTDIDVRLPHIEIMTVLKEEGTLHPAEIGTKLHIAKAQMTHLIDKLVELELVERSFGESDRRTINITLTDKGRNFLEKHENIIFNAVGEYISDLDESELETLSTSLRNLRDILLKL
ncbi:MAG TPA: MarR family transcriptional regulator [Dehalococcoidia bacterium]|nr:MarR family transcriptional regulator [Dehalococcoidia bacterium]